MKRLLILAAIIIGGVALASCNCNKECCGLRRTITVSMVYVKPDTTLTRSVTTYYYISDSVKPDTIW